MNELSGQFRTGCIVVILAFFAAGCDNRPSASPPPDHHDAATDADAKQTNRMDVPEAVRRNLGITFAKVEIRPVAQTIRTPGRFELPPQARREYRTMLAGRVEPLVRQFDRVEPGTPLYRLASPEWRDLQTRLSEAETVIRRTEALVASITPLMAAHRNHESVLSAGVALWEKRVKQLEESHASGVVSVDEMTAAQSRLAEKQAELAEVLEKEAEL